MREQVQVEKARQVFMHALQQVVMPKFWASMLRRKARSDCVRLFFSGVGTNFDSLGKMYAWRDCINIDRVVYNTLDDCAFMNKNLIMAPKSVYTWCNGNSCKYGHYIGTSVCASGA